MNQPNTPPAAGSAAAPERCLCREIVDQMRDCLGVSPEVRQHFANSRIEFLKAIRTLLDQRIERLSRSSTPTGSHITVE